MKRGPESSAFSRLRLKFFNIIIRIMVAYNIYYRFQPKEPVLLSMKGSTVTQHFLDKVEQRL